MNILFICTFNRFRSLTAEQVFKNHPYNIVRSAGTSVNARRRVTKMDVNWADIVFVMEDKHQNILEERYPTQTLSKKIISLDIPDIYPYMDEELVQILKQSLSEYLKI